MARIEKLQIQGFRSFGADDHDPGPQKVDFVRRSAGGSGGSSPLTLILGQNGCGKTTIIECLRYIVTGDCPPGSFSGRSFVHDPKMAKEATVTGNVKIQFVGNDGDKYVVTRSMEASQRAKTLTTKTLDSSITRRKSDGTVSTLSMKCADINTQIFQALGVTKPILNYVIFCHQEESNWPLDEGSKLKDKFDEIFESAKYKECLKNIKETRAHQKKLHMDMNKDIEYLRSDKKLAEEKKKDFKNKKEDRESLMCELQSLEEELTPINEEIRELNEVETNFAGIQEKITKAKTSLEHCQSEMRQLESTLDFVVPMDTSDEQIEEMKSSLDGEEHEKKERLEEIRREMSRASDELRRCDNENQRITSKIGECKGLRAKYEGDKKDLAAALASTARALGWDSGATFDTEVEILDAIENIRDTAAAHEDKLRTVTEELEAKIEDESNRISRLEIQQAQLDEQKKMKKSELIKIKREMATIKRDLSDIEDSKSKLDDVKRKLERKEFELSDLKSNFDRDNSEAVIKQLKATLSNLEQKESALKAERASLDAQREITSEISIKRTDMEDKEKRVERTLAKNCTELSHVFEGKAVPELSRLKSEFNLAYEKHSATKKDIEKTIQRLKAEIGSKRDHRKTVQQDIATKEEKLRQLERLLEEVNLLDQDFDEALESSKSDVDKARFELQVKEANKFTYQEFIDRLQKMQASRSKPHCPTCNRSFEKDSEVKSLIEELESEIRKIPSKVQSLQTKLNKAVLKQEKFQGLYPEKKLADQLRKELNDKKSQLTQLDKEIKQSEDLLVEKDDLLEVAELDFSMCDNLREDILNLDRLHADISSLSRRIDELNDQCPNLGATRDYEVVNLELENISREIGRVREDFDSNKEIEVQFVRNLNELERQRNELDNQKLNIERRCIERSKMESKKVELETLSQTLESDLIKIEDQVRPLASEISELNSSKIRLVSEKDKKSRQLRQEIDQVKQCQMKILGIQKQIDDYNNSINESSLTRLLVEKEKLSSRRTSAESRYRTGETEKSGIDKDLMKKSERKRQLEDNIRLRTYKIRVKEYESQKRKYEERLEELNYSSVRKKKDSLLKQKESAEKKMNEKKGRLSEMEVSIKSLERELGSDKLKNAETLHRQKSVEARVRQIAINDLDKYYRALDWAIMKFHQERMSQINLIIRELWQAVYKGNDIDYIAIKTDDLESLSGADKRRVSNYKVVMSKNDTEMDMRGRCSAGQKVLASLIIRLALAETFSTNFGMIALDEPTTNLDRENIDSLATALSDLVSKRSNQSNFQLIVITHDEDLIDLLSKVDQVEYYYKVSRNDRGLSIIRKILNASR